MISTSARGGNVTLIRAVQRELLFDWEAAAVVICGLALLKKRRSDLACPRRT